MNIDIHHITRVEGHGRLVVDVKNKKTPSGKYFR